MDSYDGDLIFVYAGDPNGDQINAPFTITQNLYRYLRSRFATVHYLDWCHTGPLPPVTGRTVILAHPNYPTNTPAWRLFQLADQVGCRNKFLIFPFHHNIASINQPFDPLVRQARHVFSICGPYWTDTISASPFAHWASKQTRLDMAVDPVAFPFVRESFQPPHARSFAYIGNSRPEKGTEILYEIFRRCHYTLHCYGHIGGPLCGLPNVVYHGYAHTIAQFGRDLCASTTMFLNTSISDANATTLLEAAAWGLVVACTKESGYYGPGSPFWGLDKDDLDGIINLLQHVQTCDEDVLWQQALKQRKLIEEHYTWGRFYSTVWAKLSSLLS